MFGLLVMHSVTNSVYRCVRNVGHVSGLCVACWVVRLGCASSPVTSLTFFMQINYSGKHVKDVNYFLCACVCVCVIRAVLIQLNGSAYQHLSCFQVCLFFLFSC